MVPSRPASGRPSTGRWLFSGLSPQYGTIRVLLLILAVGAVICSGAVAFAQTPPAGGADSAAGDVKPDNGVFSLVLHHADFITVTILLLSVTGLTLIFQGFLRTRASIFMPESSINTIREMIMARKFKELIDFTETDPSFVSRALNPALKRAPNFTPMKEAMETSIGEQTAEAFRSIEYLNIIGNLGPLLGLLGTVLGMIKAFEQLGGADPGKLGDGIAVALSHTFMGLFLAVPCLACFGVLRTLVDRLTVRAALVSEELLLMMRPQEKTLSPVPARPGAVPQPARKIPAPAPIPAS